MTIKRLKEIIEMTIEEENDLTAEFYKGRRTAFKFILDMMADD